MKKSYNQGLKLTLALVTCVFLFSFISAAAASMTTPVSYGNYTSPLTITLTTPTSTFDTNITNVTCWYNSSGGDVEQTAASRLVQILNSSYNQTTFTGTSVALSSEVQTYNITCRMYATNTLNSSFFRDHITIDNTNPTPTVSVQKNIVEQYSTNQLTCTCADNIFAKTTTRTLTKGDASTVTITSSPYTATKSDLNVLNKYTYTCACTDATGNTASSTATFRVETQEEVAQADTTASQAIQSSNKGIIIAIIIILLLLVAAVVAIWLLM